jgi:hypothetical protein
MIVDRRCTFIRFDTEKWSEVAALSGNGVSQPQSEKMTLSSKESWTIVCRAASGRIRRLLP